MIRLFSGTPGGGKSLHMAREIYLGLKYGKIYIVANFPINLEVFPKKKRERIKQHFFYLRNDELTPKRLMMIEEDIRKEKGVKRLKEGAIQVYIDEAHLLFDSRTWKENTKIGWPQFMATHRHHGFGVTLCTQKDTRIDKQIRGLIEIEVKHRKLSYFGTTGRIMTLGGLLKIFVASSVHFDTKFIVGSETFFYNKKMGKFYDSYGVFLTPEAASLGLENEWAIWTK